MNKALYAFVTMLAFAWLSGLPLKTYAQTCTPGHTCSPYLHQYGLGNPNPWYTDGNAACAATLNGKSAIIPIPGGEIVGTHTNCTGAGPDPHSGNYACACTDVAFDGSATAQWQAAILVIMDYCPSGMHPNGPLCESDQTTACPVADLTPITDPLALENESGQYSTHPDLGHATPAIQTAAQCVTAAAQSYAPGAWARVNSAFRPQTYQNHIREVWDKWVLLKDNNMPQCAALKARVIQEKEQKHHLVHQPGVTSQHTVGKAMDLSISPYSDNMRSYLRQHCNLKQPVPTDKVHYEPN